MPNAPYVNPPIDPKVKDAADGIYFGWMGLAQDATFRANMALIIQAGMTAALTDPIVIAADKKAMKDAVTELVAAGVIPDRDDWRKGFTLIAIACVAVRKSVFLQATDPADVAALKARLNSLEIDLFSP